MSQTKKKPTELIILCVCLLAAVILVVTLFSSRAGLKDQVDTLTADLAASRT